jgi:hypothetical protein
MLWDLAGCDIADWYAPDSVSQRAAYGLLAAHKLCIDTISFAERVSLVAFAGSPTRLICLAGYI